MIKTLEGFPSGVVALLAEGHVTKNDYETTVIPQINAALKSHEGIRLYYEIGPSFQGIDANAAWEDFKVGFEHLSRWERIAVVTDVGWMRVALGAFRFLMPGRLHIFGMEQTSHARAWILADR